MLTSDGRSRGGRAEDWMGPAMGQSATQAIRIRRVTVDESSRWLAAAWEDIARAPGVSLGYGLAVAGIGLGLMFGLSAFGLGSLILPLIAGFMLVGPVVAIGLYEISRRHERGETASLRDAVTAWRRNGDQVLLMGLALMIALFAWMQVALIIFALFFHGAPPSLEVFLEQVLFRLDNLPFLIVGTLAGGVLAALVFAMSVVAMPMLLDRDVTAGVAITASLHAVRANWQVMIGWAATLAVLVWAGVAFAFVGLALALPLAGHASWHAYRAMVD